MKAIRTLLNVIGANALILAFCVCGHSSAIWWKTPVLMGMFLLLSLVCFTTASLLKKDKLNRFTKNVLRVLLAFHDARDSYRTSLSSTRGSVRRTVRQ